MSESSSLFVHVHITKENLNNFMNSAAKNVGEYLDWLPWFELKQRVYGDVPELLKNSDGRNQGLSGHAIGAEHMRYDPETQVFTLDNLFLSESFEVFLPIVAALRGLEQYIEPDTDNNFVLIYPYWWGETSQMDEPPFNMYVSFEAGKSYLPDKIDLKHAQLANQFFDANGEALANEIIEKYGRI
ncbi:hypothetical protein [Culicoidibacter larvae]|uniref:Uncharacterized protein n=1 Tax=Culicoidibacter larvae TaxID=2579976 RepID=A0A5R8QD26_9FIRM|nr:hypothetical protein [Culicoidibacter larvae]TLG74190.1 hypothetical protein FEZ08_05655 [Culicoidibacter larvae]